MIRETVKPSMKGDSSPKTSWNCFMEVTAPMLPVSKPFMKPPMETASEART